MPVFVGQYPAQRIGNMHQGINTVAKNSAKSAIKRDPKTVGSDIEIARAAKPKPIEQIGAVLGIPKDHVLAYGRAKAKVDLDYISTLAKEKDGKLILVTGISPTPAGEGKTTTTVGLGDALAALGKKTAICLREPSLGPCFGVMSAFAAEAAGDTDQAGGGHAGAQRHGVAGVFVEMGGQGGEGGVGLAGEDQVEIGDVAGFAGGEGRGLAGGFG